MKYSSKPKHIAPPSKTRDRKNRPSGKYDKKIINN